jgi:DNA-binding transcriptional ArsR family regulator
VSKHLKVLEKAGLVSRGREAQWRPVKLEAGPMKDVTDWLEPYRQLWEARFDRLEAYLATLAAAEAGVAPPAQAAAPSPAPPEEFDDGPYR